jgi:CBS domain containing-hemolysin-like protein
MFKSFQKKSQRTETTEIAPSEPFKIISENLNPPEREMIRGILNLSKQNARDIMIPRVDAVTINQETAIKELVNIVSEAGHSRIPVYKDTIDNIIGILYVKDLLKFISEKATKSYLKKILHKPLFIPETMTLDELLIEFQKKRQHLAIVVDEYGGVAGLVTMEDILEEIVGEINDEFDEKELPEIVKIKKDMYDLDSRLSIFDFNNELKVNLPTEEFETIGGFVFDIFGKIPDKNETIEYKNFTFKIKDIEGTKINRIMVTISNSKKK